MASLQSVTPLLHLVLQNETLQSVSYSADVADCTLNLGALKLDQYCTVGGRSQLTHREICPLQTAPWPTEIPGTQ